MPYRMRQRGWPAARIALALCAALATPFANGAEAQTEQLLSEGCLLRELSTARDDVTVGELRARCAREAAETRNSLLLERMRRDRAAEGVRSLLTTHRRNYLIPASYSSSPNVDPFADVEGVVAAEDDIDNVEAKFQLSIKVSLAESLLTRRDRIYFGFTALSFWQAYNRHVSAPFRETNYEPEFFWTTPLDWGPLGLDAGALTIGLSHQSNGRGGTLSRSWNRVYANLQFEKENLVVGLRPWWRIPEDEKDDPTDAIGDDNPDIEDYLGHFDLTTVYRRGDHEWSVLLRGNTSTGKGAVNVEWAFPLWRGVRGFAQYFNGYGESLIDYDAHIERIGVGVVLNDLL